MNAAVRREASQVTEEGDAFLPGKGARVENSILGIIESGARYRVSIIRY